MEYEGFIAGETVYVRHFQRGQVGGLFPMLVVRDEPDGVLLWGPTGNTFWVFDMPDGRTLTQTPLAEWSTTRRVPAAVTRERLGPPSGGVGPRAMPLSQAVIATPARSQSLMDDRRIGAECAVW
jgi:hypothetical protein